MKFLLVLFLVLTFIGPLIILLTGTIDLRADYRTANRDSSRLAPDPAKTKEAVIQIYAARTFNWRGLFAVHTWMAVKPKEGEEYTVYQVIGWLFFRNLPPVVSHVDIPDRHWFDQKPMVIADIRGQTAEEIIPDIAKAVANYPYPNQYSYWPGPNSNTFIAHLGRQLPALKLALPGNATGKDYLPAFTVFARAPSGTGYQFSIYGLFGILLAKEEGLEINLLGLVYGVNPFTLTFKLPGLGDIKL